MLGSTWHSKKMRQSSWSCCKILSSTIECTLLSLCNYNTNLWCTKLSVWKTKLSDGTHVDCRLHMIHMTWELLTLHLSQCMHWKQIWGRWNSLLRDPLGYRPKLLPAKKMGCWNSEKVTLSQGQCFPTTAGQLSLPNMAAFGGSKDSRVFVASGIKHAWTWADQFFKFSISRTVDRWSRKKIPERLHNWPKKKHSDFSDDLDFRFVPKIAQQVEEVNFLGSKKETHFTLCENGSFLTVVWT